MKKNFEQPALEVVQMNRNDIVTTSNPRGIVDPTNGALEQLAPGQRSFDSWDAGY